MISGKRKETVYNPRSKTRGADHARWIEDPDAAGLRLVGYANEIEGAHIQHNGWYVDNFQNEIVRGIVFRLPSRESGPVFVYGYADPWETGAAYLSFDNDAENEAQAAQWADQMAEWMAEDAREHDMQFQAEQQIDEARETIAKSRAMFRALAAELRGQQAVGPYTCSAIRAQIAELRRDTREAIKRIRELTDEPWRAVSDF